MRSLRSEQHYLQHAKSELHCHVADKSITQAYFGFKVSRRLGDFLFLSVTLVSFLACEVNPELNATWSEVRDLAALEEVSAKVIFQDLPPNARSASLTWAIEVRDSETHRLALREWLTDDDSSEGLQLREAQLNPVEPSVSVQGGGESNTSGEARESTLFVELPPLPRGVYEVTLFKEGQSTPEEGGAPRYQPCPQPSGPRDPFERDGVDPVVALWFGELSEGVEVRLTPQRLSCGAGEVSTSVSGALLSPVSELSQLMITLEPLDGFGRPSAFPLLPFVLESRSLTSDELTTLELSEGPSTWRSISWRLPQVPHGRYAFIASRDDDLDQRLTPCDLNTMTGGDRWRSERREVEVERGVASSLERPLTLREVGACAALDDPPEEGGVILTRAQIEVSDELKQALSPRFDELREILIEPQVWYQLNNTPPHPLMTLSQLIASHGAFSLLTASEALTSPQPLTLWVDAGEDGRFEPCEGASFEGADVRWWSGDSSVLRAMSDPLPSQELTLSARCEAPLALITGEVLFEISPRDTWGSRHLLLEREDLFSGARVTHDLGLLSRQQLTEEGRRFEHRVAEGSYAYRAYLDQGGDGQLTPCDEERLGEVFSTPGEELVSVRGGERSAPQTLRLSPTPCLYPTTTLNLSFERPLKQRSVEGVCAQGEVLSVIKSGGDEVAPVTCRALQEGSILSFEGLYQGTHEVSLCLSISPTPGESLSCAEATVLIGRFNVEVSRAPTQRALLSLSEACACPEALRR